MKRTLFTVVGTSLLLGACGGNLFEEPDQATTTGSITPANALTTTRASWQAALASGNLATIGSSVGLSAGGPGSFSKANGGLSEASLTQLLQKVPFGPDEIPCLASGTATISGDIADPTDPTRLSINDTFRVVYAACNDGIGEVLDGTIDMTVRDFVGDLQAGTYMLSMGAVTTDFQVAVGGETILNNGDTTLALDTMQTPLIDVGTSGATLRVDSNSRSDTLTGYQSNQTLDGNLAPAPYTFIASGTLDSTSLNGTIRYSTIDTFQGVAGEFPSQGRFRVQGSGSSLELVTIDNVNVDIEIDTNGDGVIDVTISTTWADVSSG
ncbi:MAG: hypothetical protein QNJ14_11355 [Woeseiaceae bacterium]|nr:hypothetical protein [Woeseiaceae bacterium]